MSLIAEAVSGAISGFGKTVKDIASAFIADPTKAAEMAVQLDVAAKQLELGLVSAVNTTMQAESKSEHWAQWLWRPFFGFTGSAILINNYILLPYFATFGVVPIPVPMEVWMMLMAVLGVAAWTRGSVQLEKVKQSQETNG